MSGKALEYPVVRVGTLMKEWVELDVQSYYFNIPLGFPIALAGKATHGDVDVVVAEENWSGMFPTKVKAHLSRNGFAHAAWPLYESRDCVQVDFIQVPKECLSQAIQYYSHGTLGNHIGLLCRSIGLRYGFKGLFKKVFDPVTNQAVGHVTIETHPSKILKLLGLSDDTVHRLRHGEFVNREESYEILKEFPWFHPEAMDLENMTAANRTREKKRPETSNLIQWLNSGNCGIEFIDQSALKGYLGKDKYREFWQKNLLGDVMYKRIEDQASLLIQVARNKAKVVKPMDRWFSAVSAKTGLKGPDLSLFASNLAKFMGCKITELPTLLNNDDYSKSIQELIHRPAMSGRLDSAVS